ncbi:MAG: hypothetical protein K0Q79_2061 [Flavipsychrobacter sp.]|jgi:hypothetical protein|nr:hypothetical protein [Flavipsychrobacter sp.]
MKPREFDDLLKQRFDQGDFEYNPRNWERLTDELDGRKKKRSILMWWLMPVAGVAASVALAVGVAPMLQHTDTQSAGTELAQTYKTELAQPAHVVPVTNVAIDEPARTIDYTKAAKKSHKHNNRPQAQAPKEEKFAIDYNNAIGNKTSISKKDITLLNATNKTTIAKKPEKKKIITDEAVITFKDEVKKPQTLSIILSGGYSSGNQGASYTAGATIRKMVNDKVFIEGEVAFTNSNLTQVRNHIPEEYVKQYGSSKPATSGAGSKTAGADPGGKVTAMDENTKTIYGDKQTENVSFNQTYLQVSPAVNYRIVKRLSIGAGPDFQKALADNRPADDPTNRDHIKVAPLFDVGLIGKTEFSVTKNLKAGLAYRKGINNVITPTGRYIDRDYLQVQVKCAIFNK